MADERKIPGSTPAEPGAGVSQGDEDSSISDVRHGTPRPGPDSEAFPGERRSDDDRPGSETGTIGGGGAAAHNPSPGRATGVDDETAPRKT